MIVVVMVVMIVLVIFAEILKTWIKRNCKIKKKKI